MREKTRIKDFSSVLTAQELMRTAAGQDLANAAKSEMARREEEEIAGDAMKEALEDWRACLAGPAFDPQCLSFYATALNDCGAAFEEAKAQHERAKETTNSARARYAASEAQVAQTEKLLDRLRKTARRKDDERQLSKIEDRVAFLWVNQ
jgi:hypothetical protein